MIKTGIKKIDDELNSLKGNTILLIGSKEKIKNFRFQFIAEGMKDGDSTLYITFENPADQIIKELKERCLEGKIIFIDVTGKAQLLENVIIVNPVDLNSILINALKVIKKKEYSIRRCYTEGYSRLFNYIPSDLAIRFSAVFVKEVSKCKVTSVIEMDSLFADNFKRFFDIVIEMNEKTRIITEEFEKEI